MTEVQYLDRGDGIRIAYHHRAGRGATIVFLPGYMSDMMGTKAVALDQWAAGAGHGMLRLDYSGCGQSDGKFEDGTLDIWRDDALAVIDSVTSGSLILVGSSMGGWLMLLIALARPDRVRALLGIAAAADFTQWAFTEEQRQILLSEGRIEEPSEYSDEPYVTTLAFWESGERNMLLDKGVAVDVPVRLLHGQRDADVPWENALTLAAGLRSDDVRIVLVKDGDHRLSRDEDIALLITTVAELLEHR